MALSSNVNTNMRFFSTFAPCEWLSGVFLGTLILAVSSVFGETSLPKPVSPKLEAAALAFTESRWDDAQRGFEEVGADVSLPAFIRGLGRLGVAETALARKETNAALAVWRSLASDAALPPMQRDQAQRKLVETERQLKGLPGRDPLSYRTILPVLPSPAVVLHVAASGSDNGDGSEAKPFSTLQQARDAVRGLKKSRGGTLPKGGVSIVVAGGDYSVRETLKLTQEDSGTAEAPVIFQSSAGPGPVFHGGKAIKGWKPIGDDAVKEKLDPAVRSKVLEAELKANGILDYGDATNLKQRPELFVDGVPQTLARWPNEGFVKTGDTLGTNVIKEHMGGCKDGVFKYVEDRPNHWTDEPDIRLYGYWYWDWFEEFQKVAVLDVTRHGFTLDKPYSSYGYRKDQRYYAVNVFRELDQPGEWYLDRRSGRIYWLPPQGVSAATANIVLSEFAAPFVTLDKVAHVIVKGLTLQEGRGDGIQIQAGADCLVAGCVIRQMGGDALVIQGGQHHGLFGCAMETLGCGAMRVDGGDRNALAPGRHFVENCFVSNIARIKRTYAPGVLMDGCGNRIAHNFFEHIPSSAMRIEGNDHLVELNVSRNVVEESDDQGGIDMFGNPNYRGVVLRWNRWMDIRGGTHCGAAGIRLDDMISGVTIFGNLFERCGAVLFGGVQIHGGKDNLVDGNVFIDCFSGFSFSRWDEKRWLQAIEPFLAQASREPYASRYPDLARLKERANINQISRNIMVRCKNTFLREGGQEELGLNAVSDEPLTPEMVSSAQQPLMRSLLLEPIPVSEMGPYVHPWRAVSSLWP